MTRYLACANSCREIIDESDVFIDVHKAIRRMAPAPRARVPRGKIVSDALRKPSEAHATDTETDGEMNGQPALRNKSLSDVPEGHPKPSLVLRRRSSGSKTGMSPFRSDDPAVLEHLKHLGPSNAATRPKQTRINTVKIKPGAANLAGPDIPKTIPEHDQAPLEPTQTEGVITQDSHAPEGGVGEGLLSSAGREASDGVHSVAVGYGTMAPNGDRMSWKSGRSGWSGRSATKERDYENASPKSRANDDNESSRLLGNNGTSENGRSRGRSRSVSTIASLRSVPTPQRSPVRRHTARSGSISENVVDVNGIKKIVLETTSSSDSEDKGAGNRTNGQDDNKHSEAESSHAGGKGASKKKRKKRGKKKKGGPGDGHESQPLLGDK
jgi:metal transporter CNNM